MPGSFDLDNTTPPLYGDALAISVCLYEPGAEAGPYSVLPNVRCLCIDTREGPEPSLARFEYIMDDSLALNFGWPSQFEQVWPIDAQGPYVVNPDDRLVVMGQNPDGSPLILFDGFAQVPQVDLTPRSQRVTFAAVGTAVRCYDSRITGRVQRDADTPTIADGSADVQTDLPCRFNPSDNSVGGMGGILGNSTATDYYTQDDELGDYPVFIDPLLAEREQTEGEGFTAPWCIPDAIKYLLATETSDEKYVSWPIFSTLDSLLDVQYPSQGYATFDPGSASASTANIPIRDYDASNKPLPEVLADFLGYAGFVLSWQTEADGDGYPETYLKIYRRDAAAAQAPKLVFLAPARTSTLDPSANNLAQIHLARDANQILNAWQVETQQRQVEVTVILAPLFEPQSGDQESSNRKQFFASSFTPTTPATTRRKYRWYGADECGDGHYNAASGQWSSTALDLSSVFPNTSANTRSYVTRYRPGSQTLIATDSEGRPLRATLEILFGSFSSDPYIQSAMNSSSWQLVTGGWRLLPDRLGIEVTVEDPEQWNGGKSVGDIRGVTWQAAPPSGKQFILRLTTVIDDDLRLPISAPSRIASPTQFTRWGSADARDHFQYASVSPGSRNYQAMDGDGTDPVVVRDDTPLAMAHAYQLRSAHEFPRLAGSLVIPYITTYYQVGDRIQRIDGRNASLQTNVGIDQGEAPSYPWVVGVSWTFEGDRQQTVLQLSDRRREVTDL